VIVGVNKFVNEGEDPQPIFRTDPASERAQIARLNKTRGERDAAAVKAALTRLTEACSNRENLMYPIVEAVKTYATVGEICGAMRGVFGEYTAATAV